MGEPIYEVIFVRSDVLGEDVPIGPAVIGRYWVDEFDQWVKEIYEPDTKGGE